MMNVGRAVVSCICFAWFFIYFFHFYMHFVVFSMGYDFDSRFSHVIKKAIFSIKTH